jgi:CTP synthase
LERQGLSKLIAKKLKLRLKGDKSAEWNGFVKKMQHATKPIKIAVVGKYFGVGSFTLADSYISVIEALKHAAYSQDLGVRLSYFDSEEFEKNPEKLKELDQFDGVVIPGGFGSRGVEGIVSAARYAREHGIPCFGLCYGMQWMVVEYARNVAGLAGANTAEIDPQAPHPVIDVMPDQIEKLTKQDYGGTMRLGTYTCQLLSGSVAQSAYGKEEVGERHRHRYEVNPEYIEKISSAGLVFSGKSPSGKLMEIAELPKEKHPFYLGTQFHPELTSRPLDPHPLFVAFIKAAAKKLQP